MTLYGAMVIEKKNIRKYIINIIAYIFFGNIIVKSSQVTFIYIALFTIQIVSKLRHTDNMKVAQHRSTTLLTTK